MKFTNPFTKKLREQVEELQQQLVAEKLEHKKTEHFLKYFRDSQYAKELLVEAESECRSPEDFKKLEILKQSITCPNYRDYITRTKKGRIVVDIHQFVL